MAGDWIKMRRGLRHDPKVIAMARELSGRRDFMNWWSDPVRVTCHEHVTEIVTFSNVTRVTVCALLDVWASLNNTLGQDGKAPFMCLQDIDDIAEIPGFGDAMRLVGWVLELDDSSLVFPNFSENNSPSKSRSSNAKSDAERAKAYRDKKRLEKESLQSVTPSRHVTPEKRREDDINTERENAGAQAQAVAMTAEEINDWIERIRLAYPRGDSLQDARHAIRTAIDAGEQAPAEILADVQKCGAIVRQIEATAPNRFVSTAAVFFGKRKWTDSSALQALHDDRRQLNGKHRGANEDGTLFTPPGQIKTDVSHSKIKSITIPPRP